MLAILYLKVTVTTIDGGSKVNDSIVKSLKIEIMRKSKMTLNKIYFWTSTVKDWSNLFEDDKYKQLVIDTWSEFVEKKLVCVYGFVLMPNHIHIIWELLRLNGKEMPHASFNKATAHLIINDLKNKQSSSLWQYKVVEPEREFRVWQRDALAVLIDSEAKMLQKLIYIHNNPLQEKWNLVKRPEDYHWSSANFYENGQDDFGFLTHYKDII